MKLAVVLIAVLILAGCSKQAEPDKTVKKTKEKAEQSSVSQAFDGLTGKTALEAKKKSEIKINQIQTQHNKELQDQIDK